MGLVDLVNKEKPKFFGRIKQRLLPYIFGTVIGLTGCDLYREMFGGVPYTEPVLESIDDVVVNENELVSIPLKATDDDGGSLVYRLENAPEGMEVNPSTNEIEWHTDYADAGNYIVKAVVDDGYKTDSQDVNITVNEINDPPVLEPISDIIVNEGDLVNINPVAVDPDGDSLFLSYSPPFDANGEWQTDYTDSGDYTVRVTVDDGYSTVFRDINVTVNDVNRAPVLDTMDDIISGEGELITVPVNAVDPEGDSLNYILEDAPEGMVLNSYNEIEWAPGYTDSGDYIVRVTVDDGYSIDFQNVGVTVNEINDPPVLDSISDIVVNEGELININPVVADPDGDSLSLSYSSPFDANGEWQTDYTDSGDYTVRVTVDDGYSTVFRDINVTVNDVNRAPVLDSIGDRIVNEKETLEIIVNGSDADGDSLSYSIENLPFGASFDPVLRKFIWTPTFDDAGNHLIKVIVEDGNGDSDYQDVNVTVNNVPCYKIAFESSLGLGNPDIYVMNEDSSGLVNLTNNLALDENFSWSPDGSKITFVSKRDGNCEIYVMNEDGTNQTNLTNNAFIDRDPSWSPDGSKIAFESYRDGNYEIYVMNANGSGQTDLTDNTDYDGDFSWSPDGSEIAFNSMRDGNYEIYVMNANGSGQTNLTNNPNYDYDPDWSPDGTKIAFESNRDNNAGIYVMNADGFNQVRLIWGGGLAWSPDGSKVAFVSGFDPRGIYVMNADGSGLINLTNSSASNSNPDWSPNKFSD